MMEGLASEGCEEKVVMIDVSGHASLVRACPRKYLKGHRTGFRPAGGKGGPDDRRGRLIGRTKGGLNTKLHAVTDAKGRP